jgi:hypothetical protein
MSQDLFAWVVAAVIFVSGMAGLAFHAWHPRNDEQVSETRDLINRLTGLVATLSALVLGLLIASANSFYNTQKASLETVSARVVELDGVRRRYGPDAQPAREILKELVTGSYERVWQGDEGTLRMPKVETVERMDSMFFALNALREAAPDSRKYLMAKAGDLATSINDQRLQMSLQLNNSISWPFMTILIAWASLLFFGFGTLARPNRTSVIGIAVGAASVASAIFLIVELSTPYSGALRLSPSPVLETIGSLGK